MSMTKKVNIALIGNAFADAVANPGKPVVQRMTMDLAKYDGFKKYTTDGVTFNINNEDRLQSIITEKPWNLNDIDARPIPEAYFEVKFNKIEQNDSQLPERYGIGVGNQIFHSHALLGAQQNSFSFLNSGWVWVNGHQIQKLQPFSPGMTVGCGILYDSYSQQKLYFTLDGQLVGTVSAIVHKGMDCFPGVTSERNGSISYTVNLGQRPFLFDTRSLPNFRGDMTNRFARLPKEIQLTCLAYVASNLSQRAIVELRNVNKAFAEGMLDNQIWRSQFMQQWPNQNRNIKFKSWYKMFINRHKLQPNTPSDPYSSSDPVFIENCEMEFECPIVASLLQATANPKEKLCNKCKKTVYEVGDQTTLQSYVEMGRCVTFFKERKREIVRGKVRYDEPIRIRPK